jgi:uncharacterized protein
MNAVFADTSFYMALLNPRDRWHNAAITVSETFREPVITSEYVLCELGSLMCQRSLRPLFLEFTTELESAPYVEIVPASHEYFEAGLKLFSQRLDKEWSLTDCISFALMHKYDVKEALASDHHFKQAGFQILLTL